LSEWFFQLGVDIPPDCISTRDYDDCKNANAFLSIEQSLLSTPLNLQLALVENRPDRRHARTTEASPTMLKV